MILLLGIFFIGSIIGNIIAVYGNVTDKDAFFNIGMCISMGSVFLRMLFDIIPYVN